MTVSQCADSNQPDRRHLRAAICWGGSVGPAAFRKLMRRFHSEQAILAASHSELAASGAGLNPGQTKALSKATTRSADYAQTIADLEAENVRVISSTQSDYPQRLVTLRNPPPLLCMRGDFHYHDIFAVAIVGTRDASRADLAKATAVATQFAAAGFTVVSGLARGVDAAAHNAALAAGGRTIAVLGSGIHNIYPPEHATLADQIAHSGALISELDPCAPPAPGTLIARNRLISALSLATIVIATRSTGGTMSTAHAARRQNRILAAIDWDDDAPSHQGNCALIADGAFTIASDDDIDRLQAVIAKTAENPVTKTPDQLPLFD